MPEALSVFTVPCLLTSPCFGFRQNIPLLAKERDVAKRQGEVAIPSPCEGKGPEGELCCPHPVMLSAAKHPCCGFLTGVRNDKKEVLGMTKKSTWNDKRKCSE